MRRQASTPVPRSKRANHVPPALQAATAPVPLAKSLARFKDVQTGQDLSQGYQLGSRIASGADGDVFRAVQLATKRDVAIKRVRVASEAIKRHVVQEVTATFHARARYVEEQELVDPSPHTHGHPCLVESLDWFAGLAGLEREVCLVMELCNFGLSDLIHTGLELRTEYDRMLRAASQQNGHAAKNKLPVASLPPNYHMLYRFSPVEVAKVMHQMLQALAFLNRHGIVHRDVKPENILWRGGGPEGGGYKLADFGVAGCRVATTAVGAPAPCEEGGGGGGGGGGCRRVEDCGTLWTMAPELLIRRAHGPNCDVWSLGVVLFEVATLSKPFNSMELLAFRNSEAESLETGFWAAVCSGATTSSSPAAGGEGRRRALPAATMPRSASSLGGLRGSCPRGSWVAGQPQRVGHPKLPHVGGKQGPGRAATLQGPGSDGGGGSGGQQQAVSGSGSGGRGGGGRGGGSAGGPRTSQVAAAEKTPRREPPPHTRASLIHGRGDSEPLSPTSPSMDSHPEKYSFLRKRSGLRWVYSGELRGAIFEDMLEEDPDYRPNAAALLQNPRVQSALSAYLRRGRDGGEGGGASSPAAAFGADPEGSMDAVAVAGESSAEAGATAAVILRQITGEAFLAALSLDENAQTA